MEQVISLQLSDNINAVYSVNFNMLPLRIYSGIGNWEGNWELSSEMLIGKQILVGNGSFIGCGNQSTILFRGKLQLTRTNKRIIPFPQSESETSIWEGSISLVGGNMQGFLSRISGNEYPNVYNINAIYSKTMEDKNIEIKVSNIKLSI